MMTGKEILREKEIQRINNAYARVFSSEDGQTVLQNLRAYFRTDKPAFERSAGGRPYDPIAAALKDGQREIILFIEHKLATSQIKGDANIETAQNTVIK